MEISRKRGDTRPGPQDWFTGPVWMDENGTTTEWGDHVTDDEYPG